MTESLTIKHIPTPQETLSQKDLWYLDIASRIRTNLERREAIASPEQSESFYRRDSGWLTQTPPPFEQRCRKYGGATAIDPESGKVKVFLSPCFSEFKPIDQLMILLEEAIHYSVLREMPALSYSPLATVMNEIEAKNRRLRMAKYLKLSRSVIKDIKAEKRLYEEQLIKMIGQEGYRTFYG